MMKKFFPSLLLSSFLPAAFFIPDLGGNQYLAIEEVEGDLLHIERGYGAPAPLTTPVLTASEMIILPSSQNPPPPSTFSSPPTTELKVEVKTPHLHLKIDRTDLSMTIESPGSLGSPSSPLTTLRWGPASFTLATDPGDYFYGLGQQFRQISSNEFSWAGRVREGSPLFGNVMENFNGGQNANTQIPILYTLKGKTRKNFALFADTVYRQKWDFTDPQKIQWETSNAPDDPKNPGKKIDIYLLGGENLLALRRKYMNLTGHPPLPPLDMFGMWVSEYGYSNWQELEEKAKSLRAHHFPLSGFVLDLQWFGGIPKVTNKCRMGSLNFDESTFPSPKKKIYEYAKSSPFGFGILLIEEAYVCDSLPEYTLLKEKGCLVSSQHKLDGFWGKGGMIDYSNPRCGSLIHKWKRKPLMDLGILGHWTDLGDPEDFDPEGKYSENLLKHKDVHNVFNFRWAQSIFNGYTYDTSTKTTQRPFILSRSGTAGIQRFGVSLWSGDIGSKLDNLATHGTNQANMSFSGIDYYGSDIGGFHRKEIEKDPKARSEMYTEWFGASMLFDIPARPHTENLCKCKDTAPDRIGDLKSNQANLIQRYELIPYYYSLAYQAYKTGDPLISPLVMFYQKDPQAAQLGNIKMIGPNLLAPLIATPQITTQSQAPVYLPEGQWYDWHTHEFFSLHQGKQILTPLYREGLFRPPLYAKAGAIIPRDLSKNFDFSLRQNPPEKFPPKQGQENKQQQLQKQGQKEKRQSQMHFDVYLFDSIDSDLKTSEILSSPPSTFSLIEDDGRTTDYQKGELAKTSLTLEQTFSPYHQIELHLGPTQGTYKGSPTHRKYTFQVIFPSSPKISSSSINPSIIRSIKINGIKLKEFQGQFLNSHHLFTRTSPGWGREGNSIYIQTDNIPLARKQELLIRLESPPKPPAHPPASHGELKKRPPESVLE